MSDTTAAIAMSSDAVPSANESEPAYDIMIFVNPGSGGFKGASLLKMLEERKENADFSVGFVNLRTFIKMSQHEQQTLVRRVISANPRVKVVAAGGDGTVMWVNNIMEQAFSIVGDSHKTFLPPIVHLPLGTGNEFGRVSGWGNVFPDDILKRLRDIHASDSYADVDQWFLWFTGQSPLNAPNVAVKFVKESAQEVEKKAMVAANASQEDITTELKEAPAVAASQDDADGKADAEVMTSKMSCFFSLGFDAAIALKFHEVRQERPAMAKSVGMNKFWHGVYGFFECLACRTGLDQIIRLKVDGKPVSIPPSVHSLQIFNIHTSADGTNFWGKPDFGCCTSAYDFKLPYLDDGLLEIAGTKGVWHLGRVRAGVSTSVRLAQGRMVEVELLQPLAVQMEGEPWLMHPGVVKIVHHRKLPVLLGPLKTVNVGKPKKMSERDYTPCERMVQQFRDNKDLPPPQESKSEVDRRRSAGSHLRVQLPQEKSEPAIPVQDLSGTTPVTDSPRPQTDADADADADSGPKTGPPKTVSRAKTVEK